MGALKNACHDELEAKRYAADEFPEMSWLFRRLAETIATDLCASSRAYGEHFVIAANLLPIIADDFDTRASAMSAFGQDPAEGLEAKPASAVGEAETPNA